MKQPVIYCHARKSDVVADDYENEHGPNSFANSPAYFATRHPDWRDGECFLALDHQGPHVFTLDRVDGKERKAS